MKRIIHILLLSVALLNFSSSCENNGGLEIPYVQVDLHLNIYGELGNPAIGSYTLVDGGVNGIIIYREDLDVFHAYDRTCTLWPDHNAQVQPDEKFEGVFTCPECGSQYLLLTGADPISGKATFGLKEYYTVVDGSLLHVYN